LAGSTQPNVEKVLIEIFIHAMLIEDPHFNITPLIAETSSKPDLFEVFLIFYRERI
jgi:hypothetical protein